MDYQNLQNLTSGRIISIFSTDLEKLSDLLVYIHIIFGCVVHILLVVSIIGFKFGFFPAIATVSSVVLFVFLQGVTAIGQGSIRASIAKKSDKRILFMNEILTGIKTIKMYVWERFFGEKINQLRKEEILEFLHSFYYKIGNKVLGLIGFKASLLFPVLVIKFSSSENLSLSSSIILISLILSIETDFFVYLPYTFFLLQECSKSMLRIEVTTKINY